MDIQCEREMVACNADGASVFFGRRDVLSRSGIGVYEKRGYLGRIEQRKSVC